MTAAKQAKAAGLKNLSQVSNTTGVSLQTLDNWHKNKPELFKTVVTGCAADRNQVFLFKLLSDIETAIRTYQPRESAFINYVAKCCEERNRIKL